MLTSILPRVHTLQAAVLSVEPKQPCSGFLPGNPKLLFGRRVVRVLLHQACADNKRGGDTASYCTHAVVAC